ncbi:GNAT family N-acetyltransferase [Devosia sp. RR2S18]|uniref:GNAT family N-acetyltransferase n=1 Tax=Devosia rhizosphaerae TaxID=3049774 RepID=UPI00253F70B1|nr:N-acetyltransferase [Devosia sp. RR2S18]WIJ25387.1 N-acetyltransferase [Devosia sp. RR2S18]
MTRSVRRLTVADLDAYRAIRLEGLREAPEAFGSSYEETSGQPETYYRAILERLAVFGGFGPDGALLGVVAFARREGIKARHAADMISVYVRPEGRGTGLARALIDAVVEHARHHVIQLHLGVGTYNTPAIRLYQRAGFAICGTEPRALFVNGRFIDEHQMVRFLDKAPGEDQ